MAAAEGEVVNASALTAMLRAVIANNRAGGWRNLRQQASPKLGNSAAR